MTEQTFTAHEGEVMFTEEMVSIPAAEYEALRMTWLKHVLISLMDWFDDVALRHRWRWLCDAVNDSDWWAMPDLATRPVVCDRCGSASIRSWRWSRRWSGGYWGVRCRTCGAEYETRGEVA